MTDKKRIDENIKELEGLLSFGAKVLFAQICDYFVSNLNRYRQDEDELRSYLLGNITGYSEDTKTGEIVVREFRHQIKGFHEEKGKAHKFRVALDEANQKGEILCHQNGELLLQVSASKAENKRLDGMLKQKAMDKILSESGKISTLTTRVGELQDALGKIEEDEVDCDSCVGKIQIARTALADKEN